jgi:hypothetical protein
MKRILLGLIGLVLLTASAFFCYVVVYIAAADVAPALQQGTLNVETSSRILNIVWEGNEIYLLLAAYLLLATACGYGSIRLFRKATLR